MKILDKAIKRDDTPVKGKRTQKEISTDESRIDQSFEKELEWVKL
jgi:hypothetical protein